MSWPVRSTRLVAFLAIAGAIPTSPARAADPRRLGDVPRLRAGQGLLVRHPPRANDMDPDSDDFRLRPDSPAPKLGFLSPKLPTVGLRDPAARHAE